MAKLLIFEGIERCGKGSIIDMIHEKHGIIKLDADTKQPVTIPFEHLGILYEGVHQFAAQFYKRVNETFLIDRYFLSEYVYAHQFQRASYMTIDYIQNVCDNNEVVIFFLKNTHEDYLERGPKNKIKLTKDEYENMTYLFEHYTDFIKEKVENITFYEIDTHDKTLESIYNTIKELL